MNIHEIYQSGITTQLNSVDKQYNPLNLSDQEIQMLLYAQMNIRLR